MTKKIIEITLILLYLTTPAFSAIYYVENKGSIALNNTNEGASAWSDATDILTPTSGATAMAYLGETEPDTVYFRGGPTKDSDIYQLGEMTGFGLDQEEYQNIWQPSYSGESGNHITIKVYPGEYVTLNGYANMTNEYAAQLTFFCNPLGVYRQNYITIDGFKLTCINADTTKYMAGTAATYHVTGTDLLGIVLRNLEIDGGSTENGNGQYNPAAIRLQDTDGAIVEYCTLYGYNGINGTHNTSAIKYYHARNTITRNNTMYDSYAAYFDKSQGIGNIFEKNFIYGTRAGVEVTNILDAPDNQIFRDNIIKTSADGININTDVSGTGLQIYNNTIYNTNASPDTADSAIRLSAADDIKVFNNLVYSTTGTDSGQLTCGEIKANLVEVDHNLFYNPQTPSVIRIRFHNQSDPFWDLYETIGAWQVSGDLVAAVDVGCGSSTNPGCGSLQIEPNFTGGESPTTVDDFGLTAGSPGKGASRNNIDDIGADTTDVGAGADPAPPSTDGQPVSIGTGEVISLIAGETATVY